MRSWLHVAGTWLALSLLPRLMGAWWDGWAFNVLQALVPLAIMLAVFRLTRDWWRLDLAALLLLQIVLNAGDAMFDLEPARYDSFQLTLNALELAVLLLLGLPTAIYRTRRDQRRPDMPDPCGRDMATTKGAQRGIGAP